jgi:uncharacterized oligopeptide transporter (OPT) family protein
MTNTRFYLWLFITSVVSLIIGILTVRGPNVNEINKATYMLIGFFVSFTVIVYIISTNVMRSSDPYLFTRVFMISISLKILFLSVLVVSCVKFLEIKPRDLIGPLLSSYLLFTILETWVLMKLSRNH